MKAPNLAPRLNPRFDKLSGVYLWALFIVIFGIWTPHLFLTSATVHSVAAQQAVGAMMAIALLIPVACGQFDLSIGATANFCGIVACILQNDHHSMFGSIVVAVFVGTVIGAVNGFIVVVLKVNSFIATLGVATIIAAFQTIATGGTQPLPPAATAWSSFTQHTIGGFQIVVLYMLVLAVVCWWLMDHAPAGRYFYAVGSNAEAARLTGVRIGVWTWLALILSGTLCGVAGVLYASLSGPSLTFGSALLLPAFAAVFLGSTQLRPGKVNVWGTLLAVYVLATGVQGLQLVTGVQWLNEMFNGTALIAAVSFAVWRQRASKRGRAEPPQSTRSATMLGGLDGPPGTGERELATAEE